MGMTTEVTGTWIHFKLIGRQCNASSGWSRPPLHLTTIVPPLIPAVSQTLGRRSLSGLVRENIKTLEPYHCARYDYTDGILLDANENSIGPSLAAGQASIRSFGMSWSESSVELSDFILSSPTFFTAVRRMSLSSPSPGC